MRNIMPLSIRCNAAHKKNYLSPLQIKAFFTAALLKTVQITTNW